MARPIELSINEFYHLYNRGTDKRIVFIDEKDYMRFLVLLHVCNNFDRIRSRLDRGLTSADYLSLKNDSSLVEIGAYCLMPNHFHILVKEKIENGISLFMQKVATGYTMYFNKKYGRSGALFQGTFKSAHADNDTYLKYLFSYIHLNPIKLIDSNWKKNGIRNLESSRNFLGKYNFSSYLDYCGTKRNLNVILNKKAFPEYFNDINSFENTIKEWLLFARG